MIRKTLVCAGCGAVQSTMDDNNHLAWCQTPTDPDDGPRKTVKIADSLFRETAPIDPGSD